MLKMRFETLKEWLDYIGLLHSVEIDLGLERVSAVADRLCGLRMNCAVITVAGTNGKGSCVAGLEAIYLAQGYRVGAFTSPFLLKHNEQVRIQGIDVSDETLCKSYERVESLRGDIPLTVFEFNTLAAFDIFYQAELDVCLLEVGLGGRLDAVNVLDADVAMVTSIAIDHADRLGDTRELIGFEKAGIFRKNQSAVCGDLYPPASLTAHARALNTFLFCQGKDFSYQLENTHWHWQSEKKRYEKLPLPSLALENMSSVLMAVELMQEKLPVTEKSIKQGLINVKLPGRVQVFPGAITKIFDVSHNPAAAEFLEKRLASMPQLGKIRAVFSMLADKDCVATILAMKKQIHHWYIAELPVKRKTAMAVLKENFNKAGVNNVTADLDIARAYQAAMEASQPGDCVLVFGSFCTVAEVLVSFHFI